jgi:hypothetical protein
MIENFQETIELDNLSKDEILKMVAEHKLDIDANEHLNEMVDLVAEGLTTEEMGDLDEYFIDRYDAELKNKISHKYELPDDYNTNDTVKRKVLAKILIDNTAKLN